MFRKSPRCRALERPVDIGKNSCIGKSLSILKIGMVALFIVASLWGNSFARYQPEKSATKLSKPSYKSSEIIVKFKESTGTKLSIQQKEGIATTGLSSIDALNKKYGVLSMKGVVTLGRKNLDKHVKLGHNRIYTLTLPSGADAATIVEKYKADANVEYAQLNRKYQLTVQRKVPNDPLFGQQWGFDNTNDADVDAPEAWYIQRGDNPISGKRVVVGIIDTGIDYEHPDLQANVWHNPGEIPNNGIDDDGNGFVDDYRGWDFSDVDNDPMDDSPDDRDHGTHVAGTVAAVTDNEIGVAGMSFNSLVMPVKIFPNSYDDVAANAIFYAVDNGAKVLNNSWGSEYPSPLIEEAINYAVSQGVLVIFAAGNDNSKKPFYPAYYAGAIAVAATDWYDEKTWFSNYGDWVDVSAPGVDILSTITRISDSEFPYDYYTGTSMAAPHVSGITALIISQHPDWPVNQVRNWLELATDNIDAQNPTFKGLLGHGRVNAFKAVAPPQPDVRFSDYKIVGETGGKRDNIVSPGETIQLEVWLANNGMKEAVSVTGTLQDIDPYVDVIDSLAGFGTIAAGGTGYGIYTFAVSPSAPVGYSVTFPLIISDGDGHFWTDSFTVTIHTSNKITGRVTRVSNIPIPDALVSYSGPLSGTVITNSNGNYLIINLVDGTYQLTAKAVGFLGATVTVTLPPLEGDSLIVDFKLGQPDIAISVDSLVVGMPYRTSKDTSFVITNNGDSNLSFTIFESSSPGGSPKVVPFSVKKVTNKGSVRAKTARLAGKPSKKEGDTSQPGPAVTLGAGGPDEFDYRWIDSDEPAGPAYNWIEISDIGRRVTGLEDDDNVGPFNIGFDFSFYGQIFNQFRVCSNGFISFTSTSSQYSNKPLPDLSAPANLIAPFWDDLYLEEQGAVYYYSDGRRLIIEYTNIPNYDEEGTYTFEVILSDDGTIVFQYKEMIGQINSATVGIQNGDRSIGLQIAYDTDYVHDDLAVLIVSGINWMSENPSSGIVPPGSSVEVTVTLNSLKLHPATINHANLIVVNNDPDIAHRSLSIPVTLSVGGAPIISLSGDKFNDSPEISPSNDGDDFPEAGETVKLSVSLVNTGSDPSQGVTATLSVNDPFITISDSTSLFGDITPGSTVSVPDGFVFTISPSVPDSHVVTLNFKMQDASGNIWTDKIDFVVEQRSTVSGQVTAKGTGVGIPGAVIAYNGTDLSSPSGADTTDEAGFYRIVGLTDDEYTFSVSANGFLKADSTVVISSDTLLNFTLLNPNIEVASASLSMTVKVGKVDSTILRISNSSGIAGDLEFSVGVSQKKGILSVPSWNVSSATTQALVSQRVRKSNTPQNFASSHSLQTVNLYTGQYLSFGITEYGEIMPFQFPPGTEHLQNGAYVSGYTVAFVVNGDDNVEWASYRNRFGIVPVSFEEFENSPTQVRVKVVTRTSGDELEITQLFIFRKDDKFIRIETNLKNLMGSALSDVVFKSFADWDVDGEYESNKWDYDPLRNMVFASEIHYAGIAGWAPPTIYGYMEDTAWDDYASRGTTQNFGPWTGDGLEILHYELGELASNASVNMAFAYGAGNDLPDLQGAIDRAFGEWVSWLSVEPTVGLLSPGEGMDLKVRFNAANLPFDSIHEAELLIRSNDPDQGIVVVPVTLIVPPADVVVSIPHVSELPGKTAIIPVNVSNLSGVIGPDDQPIKSARIVVTFDSDLLLPDSISTVGTISEAALNTFRIVENQIIIGLAQANPFEGEGALVNIICRVHPEASFGDSVLIWADVLFNEGGFTILYKKGVFTVAFPYFSLSGGVNYYHKKPEETRGAPVSDVIVHLTGQADSTKVTDPQGRYLWPSLRYGRYVTRAIKFGSINNAVSPYDAALVLQYSVGLIPLAPYQKIAGDVTGNGDVGPYDASWILRRSVELVDTFPVELDWKFVPKDAEVTDQNWPNPPDSLFYDPLDSDLVDQDFAGILIGDISGNWSPGAIPKPVAASIKPRSLSLDNVSGNLGSRLLVPVRLDDSKDVIALGLTLSYNPKVLKATRVLSGELSSGSSIEYNVLNSSVKVALASARSLNGSGTVVQVEFEVLKEGRDAVSSINIVKAELNEGQIPVAAKGAQFRALPKDYALSQNYPNPFNPQTTIVYQLPSKGQVKIAIYSMSGQSVRALVEGEKEAGYYSVVWDGRDSSGRDVATGVYLYRLEAEKFSKVKKMLLMR